jgi:Protein of unknown function (DUF1186)
MHKSLQISMGKLFKVGQDGKHPEHHWELWLDNGLVTKDREHLEKSNMSIESYAPPVDKLLTYGDGHKVGMDPKDWPEYLELGIGPEHIPDLIRMATDEELNTADPDSLEVWAPLHAWRILGILHAEAAIEPLLSLLKKEYEDDEWAIEELPEVYALLGPAAIPALARYIDDESHSSSARTTASSCLEKIATQYPESRDECVAILTQQLERFAENDEGFNAFLIYSLVNLKALEAAPLMERAFAADRVDIILMGDWDDVQVELGLKSEEEVLEERRNQAVVENVLSSIGAGGSSSASAYARQASRRSEVDRRKAKKKMAKQSRKKNKKRK